MKLVIPQSDLQAEDKKVLLSVEADIMTGDTNPAYYNRTWTGEDYEEPEDYFRSIITLKCHFANGRQADAYMAVFGLGRYIHDPVFLREALRAVDFYRNARIDPGAIKSPYCMKTGDRIICNTQNPVFDTPMQIIIQNDGSVYLDGSVDIDSSLNIEATATYLRLDDLPDQLGVDDAVAEITVYPSWETSPSIKEAEILTLLRGASDNGSAYADICQVFAEANANGIDDPDIISHIVYDVLNPTLDEKLSHPDLIAKEMEPDSGLTRDQEEKVTKIMQYFAYLYPERFFKDGETTAYLNSSRLDEVSKLSLFERLDGTNADVESKYIDLWVDLYQAIRWRGTRYFRAPGADGCLMSAIGYYLRGLEITVYAPTSPLHLMEAYKNFPKLLEELTGSDRFASYYLEGCKLQNV